MQTNTNNIDSEQALVAELLARFDGDASRAVAAIQRTAAEQQRHDQAPKFHIAADAPDVVSLQNISKMYKLGRQKVEALKSVSLTIKQGEFVAITGTSGSGKSTLLQLIGGLDKPTAGSINVDGHDLSKLSDRKLSVFRNQTVGFVFQFFYLQPFLKLQANLEVPGMFARAKGAERRQRATELARAVDLDERLNHFPRELSGGQMQRAAIARALLNRPKILLADEPTGNLDSANGSAIIELFETIRRDYGTTVIVVTHDSTIARRADREIIMKDGAITV
jgi:ABC-type lipoprotein export system ATPase subunit